MSSCSTGMSFKQKSINAEVMWIVFFVQLGVVTLHQFLVVRITLTHITGHAGRVLSIQVVIDGGGWKVTTLHLLIGIMGITLDLQVATL